MKEATTNNMRELLINKLLEGYKEKDKPTARAWLNTKPIEELKRLIGPKNGGPHCYQGGGCSGK